MGGTWGWQYFQAVRGGYLGLTFLARKPIFSPVFALISCTILPDPLFSTLERFEKSSFFTIRSCRQDRDFCCAKMLFSGTPLALRAHLRQVSSLFDASFTSLVTFF